MRKVLLFVGVLALIGPSWASAAEEETLVMEEVVVTATRTEQAVEKVPAQVTVVTRDQIEASGARSVPDVLSGLAGVYVSDLNGNGMNQTVDMGGFGETANRHVAVVIDGRRVNPIDQSGPRWATISLDNIERIEVLSGGGSVLYGDQAMGGVINIITKKPSLGTEISLEAGIGDTGKESLAAGMRMGDTVSGFTIDASTRNTAGYRANSAMEQDAFSTQYTHQVSDAVSGRLQLEHTRAEYQFPGSLTAAQMAQNRRQTTTPNDEESSSATTLVGGMAVDLGNAGTADIALSYREENRNASMVSWWMYYDYIMTTVGVNAKYVLDAPLAGTDNRLTVGVDYYGDAYDLNTGFAPAAWTNFYRHQRNTLAGYVQDEMTLWDDLTLNLGVRSEKPDTELRADVGGATTTTDKDKSEYAWNVGAAYRFMKGSKVYARAYRAFRYPVVDEYTSLWTGAMNTALEPETSMGYEAGLRVLPMDTLLANVRAFLFDVDDEIAWNGGAGQNENIGETRHQGFELSLRYAPVKSVAVYGNAAYTDVEFTKAVNTANNGKKVPQVPEWKGHAGLDLTCPLGFRYRLQYNYVGEQYQGADYANASPEMESYETVDMYLTYRLKNAELFLNATNVFNEEYCTSGWVGGYYPMPESSYFGGIRLKF